MEKLPPGKPRDQDSWGVFKNNWFNQFLGGFGSLFGAITGTVNNDYIAQIPIIGDHEARLTATEEAVRQSILQGEAVTFSASGWWKPPRDLIYAELIGIAGGGGGAAGTWNAIAGAQRGGDGGGADGLELVAGFRIKRHEVHSLSLFSRSPAR